jgi:hypothetical protein
VELPERAREKLYRRDTMTGGYFVLAIPYGHGGTEDLPLESHRELIKPALGIWPLQKEEWDLDYWTARGFTIFVVHNERDFLNPGQIPLYRTLHMQIKERCELVSVLPALRPLFEETELRIYRIRDRDGSAAHLTPNESDSAPIRSVGPAGRTRETPRHREARAILRRDRVPGDRPSPASDGPLTNSPTVSFSVQGPILLANSSRAS